MGIWNNRQNVAKAPYRYRITGYTVGGPVYIPKVFNTKRDKLFFFWNQEYTGQRKDYGTRFQTMPTAAERGGDFSKSVTGSGTAIKIVDPLNEGVVARARQEGPRGGDTGAAAGLGLRGSRGRRDLIG